MLKPRLAAGLLFVILASGAASHEGPGPCDSSYRHCSNWTQLIEYPEDARLSGVEGSVTFEVQIDTDGHAFDCRILASSGDRGLDQSTCEQFEEVAHFTPALDAEGRPTTASYCTTITWSFGPQEKDTARTAALCRQHSTSGNDRG